MVSTKNRARAGRIAELERSYGSYGKLRLSNKCHLKFLRPAHTSDESEWQGRLNYLSKIIPEKLEKSMQGELSDIKHVPQQLEEMQGKLNKDLPQHLKDLPQQLQEMQGKLKETQGKLNEDLPQRLKDLPQQLKDLPQQLKDLQEMQGKLNEDMPQQLKEMHGQLGELGQLKELQEQLQEVREEVKALREGRMHGTHVQDVQRHGNPGAEWLPMAPVLE